MPDRSPSQRAHDFALRHGDALAAARARCLRAGADARAVLSLLGDPAEAASLAARMRLLWLCMDAGLLASPTARVLCVALAREQRDDGAWRDDDSSQDEALRCTGTIAGCLARGPFVRPETLEAAGDCLARSWDPDRVSHGRLRDLHAYAFYFANAPHEHGDEVLQWCGRELERGLRTRAFRAVEIARVLLDCDAHSLPGAQFAAGELLVALLTEQAPDGSFGSAAEPAARVEPTLHGLHALLKFSRA